MADPCGTGGVARYLDRLGDQAGPASPLEEAEGQPWHPPLSCPSPEWATGKDKRADEGADTSAAINALQAAMDTLLEAKDSEIAGLKEDFEVGCGQGRRDGRLALSNSSAGWRIWMPSAGGRTSCVAVSMISAASSPTPRPSWPLPRTKSRLLTQAEAERRARGVLARLRAAWRGG